MNIMIPRSGYQQHPKKPANGYTLIELMVSILIGLILLGVMSMVFLSNKQSYHAQDTGAQMQENGRYAIEVLTRDIRLAGYWGGFEDSVASLTGAISPTTSGCDATTTNWTKMAAQRVYGLNGTNDDGSVTGDYTACIAALPKGDIVVVRHASPNALTAAQLTAGGLYLLSDIDKAQLFTGTTPPAPPTFKTPSTMHQMMANAYFLDDSLVQCSTGPTPSGPLRGLMRLRSTSATTNVTEEIIGGVEDFQVVYGVDNVNTDGTSTVDFYTDAASTIDWPNVISVRVWLLLRAACGENGYTNTTIYTNPSGVATPVANDSIRRQVFTTTIFLRNPRHP